MQAELTGVVLNWKRPENVTRIVDGWQSGGLLADAIVWNNNPAIRLEHGWAKVLNANQDIGLYTRFAAASLASTRAVLIQDDDLELPTESIRQLYEAWLYDREVIHGVFGRRPKPDGSYAWDVLGEAEVPIVLTRALICDRLMVSRFFQVAPLFDEIQREGRPAGNGEDILFSYSVRGHSGRLNRVHEISIKELPAPHAIHGRGWQAHIQHRTKLLRACEAWLEECHHEDRRDLLHL